MLITADVKKYMQDSTLCWLATSDKNNQPNVSPKELFIQGHGDQILVAEVISHISMTNILQNPLVCISFINIFTQKGYNIKGVAEIIAPEDKRFKELSSPLMHMVNTRFTVLHLISIEVKEVTPIIAPSYYFIEEITEQEHIDRALKSYHVQWSDAENDE